MGGDRPGALVGTRLSVLAAECADPDRYRRGRAAFKDHAVLDCDVAAGVVTAHVQGSLPESYVVTLSWRPLQRPGVVPLRAELHCRCTCPDMTPVCKHGVATLLQFADNVAYQPGLLETWRAPESSWAHLPLVAPEPAGDSRPGLRLVAGTDRDGIRRSAPGRRPEPEPEPESSALREFFGVRVDPLDWTPWDPGLPELVAPSRPATTNPMTAVAAQALDEAMGVLGRMYGPA
jgi:hypothetical protein